VRVDGTNKQAEVLLQSVSGSASIKDSSISPMAHAQTSAGNSRVTWTWLENNEKSLNVGESISKTNVDLSAISKISLTTSNSSSGTYYQHKSGKKTNTSYYSDFRNFVDFGNIRSFDNKIYKTSVFWEHDLTAEEKKHKSITVGVRLANAPTKDSSGNFKNVTAYYTPIQLQLLTPEMTDADAIITPREYISGTDYKLQAQSYAIDRHAGFRGRVVKRTHKPIPRTSRTSATTIL
jgi:hypothetical protein